jgi:pimeloyl-ACP methyl ester carboxylesterase
MNFSMQSVDRGNHDARAKTRRFKVSRDLTIVGDVMGPVDGQPVLLLHGGGQTRGSWKNSIQNLAEIGYRGYSIDARGHGDSDRSSDGNYTIDAFCSDLLDIIRKIGRPPILIGASLGGIVSLLAAGEGGTTVARALVLVDVAARTNPYGVARIQAFMRANSDGFASVAEAADAVARYATDRPRPRNTKGLERNLRKIGDRYYWHWDERFLDSWRPSHQAAMDRLENAARQLTMPVLIVHAGHSDVLGQEEVDHLRALAPHAEYARVDNAGHMVVGDKNSEFNSAILDFLVRHAPSTSFSRVLQRTIQGR